MTNEELKACREAFEKWYSDNGNVPENTARCNNGSYRKRNANYAWTTWKAACRTRAQSAVDVEAAIHYPECWDTAAYPTVESALAELCAFFKCSNADCTQGHIALAGGASTIPAAINVVLDDLVRADGRDESDFSHGYYTALDEAKYRIATKLKEMGVE